MAGYSVHLKGSKFKQKSKFMSYIYLDLHILYKPMVGQGKVISICTVGLCLEFTHYDLDGCIAWNNLYILNILALLTIPNNVTATL